MTFYWLVLIFVAFGLGTQVGYHPEDDDDKKDANRGNGQRLN